MIKIFRNVRKQLIQDKKLSSYLLYALGEIVLVMIGILLALQVNNLNEERKTKNQLNSILKAVTLDLKIDTIAANNVTRFYDTIKKKSDLIIQKKLNRKTIHTCPECRSLVTVYKPFIPQKKGYELLKNFSDNNNIKNDTLVTNITQFYNSFIILIEDSNTFVKEEVLKNIQSFKKEDWFVEWSQGKTTDKMLIYFSESEEYRKMVAGNDILAGRNHKLFVDLYNKGAKELLTKLNERLKNLE